MARSTVAAVGSLSEAPLASTSLSERSTGAAAEAALLGPGTHMIATAAACGGACAVFVNVTAPPSHASAHLSARPSQARNEMIAGRAALVGTRCAASLRSAASAPVSCRTRRVCASAMEPLVNSISDAEVEDLVQDAVVWANQHGLVGSHRR